MEKLLTTLLILGVASVAMGADVQLTATDDLGGGMFGYTLTALGEDAQELSLFVEVTIECVTPGVDVIHQLQSVLPPFTYDINDEAAADLYDTWGGYSKPLDSWYGSEFYSLGNIQVETWADCLMHLESGTKPEYTYENAKVAYVALTGQAHVYGTVFREGEPFGFDFIIPEPAALGLIVAGGVALIRRRRR